MDTRSSFADPEVQSRQLKDMFKFSDSSGNGTLSFDEFVAAMVRLNFVGVPKEMEALFKAFDKDGSGMIDYRHVFLRSPWPRGRRITGG
jgi:Ca2+-binding EF-hand superfamily protein